MTDAEVLDLNYHVKKAIVQRALCKPLQLKHTGTQCLEWKEGALKCSISLPAIVATEDLDTDRPGKEKLVGRKETFLDRLENLVLSTLQDTAESSFPETIAARKGALGMRERVGF